jgi:hypothetical protein
LGLSKENGVSARADTPKNYPQPEAVRSPQTRLVLGSGLGFAHAFLEALSATMTAAVKFLGAFDLLMGHEIAP